MGEREIRVVNLGEVDLSLLAGNLFTRSLHTLNHQPRTITSDLSWSILVEAQRHSCPATQIIQYGNKPAGQWFTPIQAHLQIAVPD
jgi:hypothetical protein